MKLKKVMLYAAPAALAGFLYFGGMTNAGEVFAKTITTMTQIVTKGAPYDEYKYLIDSDEHYSDDCFEEGDRIYVYSVDVTGGRLFQAYERIVINTEIQIEVPDDEVSEKTVPDRDPERLREEALQKQREEEALKVQKETEQISVDFVETITNTIEGILSGTENSSPGSDGNGSASTGKGKVAVIETDYFTCFTQDMLDILAAHPDVSYEIHYRYQGKRYVLTIPAGADFNSLKDSEGYYGFRYLDSIFGGYEEME